MKKVEIVRMTCEETQERVKWAKSRGLVKLGTFNQTSKGEVVSSLREILEGLDFAEVINWVMKVQNLDYGFIFEIKEVPYEIEPSFFLKIANEVLASK
jgi:hypothetical protein